MSVLGKRTRSTRQSTVILNTIQDVEILPPRKRSKKSLPHIHEDAETTTSTRQQASRRPLKSCRSRQSVQPQDQQPKVIDEDIELLDANLDASEQDENLPPVETLLQTPSKSRFKNVLVNSPLTPKRTVRVGGLLTPKTPRTQSAIREQNIYARARQLFTSSSAPAKLIGRDSERRQLHEFVKAARNKIGGQCIYISGPPGTGKSGLVQEVLQQHTDDQEIRISTINCVGLRTAVQVYGKLVEDLAPEQNTGKNGEQFLKRLFTATSGQTAYVVMLDEIDSLVESECDVLYNLFEWALKAGSNLSLIGVANSLDLTDRFLPRLKSKGLKPRLLPFLPYNAQQIAQIISDKLRTLLPENNTAPASFTPCIHPAAIQLCAKKIASQTGDLRKAFNLIRRSLDQIEKDTMSKQTTPTKTPLGEITNTAQLFQAQLHTVKTPVLTAESAPRASIAHVAKLASSIFNQGTTSRLSGLNLQQKAVLCSVVNKEVRRQARNPFMTPTKSANKAPSVAELFQKYTSLCKRDDGILQPLKDTEFRDVVASLETLGLVHESKSRSSSLLTPTSSSRSGKNHDERQIVSAVTDKEMRDSLNGPGADLLRRLLEEI